VAWATPEPSGLPEPHAATSSSPSIAAQVPGRPY
jgi:hypothetical protein